MLFFPLSDHSTMAVIRTFAAEREFAEIPEAANTVTANSCSESSFGRTRTRTLEVWIEKAGIPSRAICFVLRAFDCLPLFDDHPANYAVGRWT